MICGKQSTILKIRGAVLVILILAVCSGGAFAATPYLVSDLDHAHQVMINQGFQIGAWSAQSTTGQWDWSRWIESNLTAPNWSTGSVGDGLLGKMLYTPSNPLAPFNNPNPELVSPAQWHTRVFSPDFTHYGHSTVYQNASVNEGLIFYGYIDEQDLTIQRNIDDARDWFAFTKANRTSVGHFPNSIVYTNQWGSQTNTVDMLNYMGQALPEMLSFDHYPLGLNNFGQTEYYGALMKYRNLSLLGNDGTGNAPIPYHTYLDLIGADTYIRDPEMVSTSAAGLRWQQMSSWTLGAKAASGFTYNKEVFEGAGTRESILFSGDGFDNPTQAFYDFAETTRQSRNLGPALVRLISTDVRRSGFYNNTLPQWTYGAGDDPYLFYTTGEIVLGYFNPIAEELDGPNFSDEVYFMILNNHALGSLEDSAQAIKLYFNFGTSGIDTLQRLSRDTGEVEIVPLTHQSGYIYYLELTLEGGTADLFKYNDGARFVMPELAFLEGDANSDGVVSAGDYASVQANFGNSGEPGILGDANGDGVVSAGDYASVQANFGNSASATNNIPEPATLFIMACGVVGIFRRRRRGYRSLNSRR